MHIFWIWNFNKLETFFFSSDHLVWLGHIGINSVKFRNTSTFFSFNRHSFSVVSIDFNGCFNSLSDSIFGIHINLTYSKGRPHVFSPLAHVWEYWLLHCMKSDKDSNNERLTWKSWKRFRNAECVIVRQIVLLFCRGQLLHFVSPGETSDSQIVE